MTVRARGFLTLLGSVVGGLALYWFLFHVLSSASGKTRVRAYPLALPLIGIVIGIIELATGLPFTKVDGAWQRLPWWLQVPLGCLIGILLLAAIVFGFYYVLSR